MSYSASLSSLLQFFGPLATECREKNGCVTLYTPEVNVLALNATYFNGLGDVPASGLIASNLALPGKDVGGLRVGQYVPVHRDSKVVVEQVSRLQLATWAAVLAGAYDTPDWAATIARHLACKLEGDPGPVLLMAYHAFEPVGALLWRAGAAHLWGTLDTQVDAPLLNAAAELSGGEVTVSLPDSSPLALPVQEVVTFTLRGGPVPSAPRSRARPR